MENNSDMQKLKQTLGKAMKLLLNEQYQEAILVVNQGILLYNKIENKMKQDEERIKLWNVLK